MAIRPENVVAHLTEEEKTLSSSLEKVIDEAMMARRQEIEDLEPILIKIGANIPEKVQEIIIDTYQAFGWKVEIISARGGRCFKFTPEKSPVQKVKDIWGKFSKQFKL